MGQVGPLEGEELRVIPVRPGICYGALGPLFLMFYRKAPTFEDLQARLPFMDAIRDDPPGAFLSVIDGEHAKAFPDQRSRSETKRQAQAYGSSVSAGAVVLEGGGVRQSLIRSFLRGLLLFKRSPMPYRFFGDVAEAADHVLEGLDIDGEGDHRAVVAAVDVLRAKAAEGDDQG